MALKHQWFELNLEGGNKSAGDRNDMIDDLIEANSQDEDDRFEPISRGSRRDFSKKHFKRNSTKFIWAYYNLPNNNNFRK